MMKYLSLTCLIFFLVLEDAFAQTPGLSYQLILETKGEYRKLDNDSKVNPENYMNIDKWASLSQFYPVIQASNNFGGVDTKLQVEGLFKNYNFEQDSTSFSFQELYTQISLKEKHHFVFGKKRLDWGTGMIWNPTNFFIQKDPLRTQNRLEGLFMLNYSYLFGNHTLSLYVFPEKRTDDFKAALKYDFFSGRIDAGVSFVQYGKYQQLGYEVAYGGNLFTFYSEGVLRNFSKRFKIASSGELLTLDDNNRHFHTELVMGTIVSFNSRFSFSGEYRFRSDYLNKQDIARYKQRLPANPIIYDPLSIGKHTLFGNLEFKDEYARWAVNLRTFYDPVSKQLGLSPLGVLSINNFQLELSALFYNNRLSLFDLQSSLLLSYFF